MKPLENHSMAVIVQTVVAIIENIIVSFPGSVIDPLVIVFLS